jgi:hypothetical protein
MTLTGNMDMDELFKTKLFWNTEDDKKLGKKTGRPNLKGGDDWTFLNSYAIRVYEANFTVDYNSPDFI